MLVVAGAPAVIALGIQAAMNLTYTGELTANGAIVKLAVNQPFLTPEEKLAEVRRFSNDLRAGVGDTAAGKVLYAKHCATCHKLFGDGGTVGPDLTLIEENDPGAEFQNHFEIVAGDELRRRIRLQDRNELAASAWIEIAGRFVERQHDGLACKDARQADTFALAEAQVVWQPIIVTGQPNRIQTPLCDRTCRVRRVTKIAAPLFLE